jgi:hypothetical protein
MSNNYLELYCNHLELYCNHLELTPIGIGLIL